MADELQKSFYDKVAEKANLRFIDSHAHLARTINWKKLEEEASAPGLKQVWLLSLSVDEAEESYFAGNDKVLEVSKEFPFFVPFGFLDFTKGVDQIDKMKDQGFLGLKAIRPPKPYDALEYMDLYQRAADLDMPVLFHVGAVATPKKEKMQRYQSYYGHGCMLPRMLISIQACVPNAKLIQGHMAESENDQLRESLCYSAKTKVSTCGNEDYCWWYENFARCDGKGTPLYKKFMLATDVTYGENVDMKYRNAAEYAYEKAMFIYFLMSGANYYPWKGKYDDVNYANAAEYFPDRLKD